MNIHKNAKFIHGRIDSDARSMQYTCATDDYDPLIDIITSLLTIAIELAEDNGIDADLIYEIVDNELECPEDKADFVGLRIVN